MFNRRLTTATVLALATALPILAQQTSESWNPDKEKEYINPIINADYSDPDVCRVGNDFYMTSSSFACFPGLQILSGPDRLSGRIMGRR